MSSIWFATPDIADMNRQMENTACSNLGIVITEVGDDYVAGTMPADERTFQPVGLVHGGANVLFAETLGSMAANLCLDNSKEYAVGQEINANHLRGVRSGELTGIARLVHKGRSSQVWEIRINNAEGKLSCISRLTMAVIAAQ
ncbi:MULTISPECIES: hotdog fold thioesterase [Oceanospirillaceae]|jgi:1,4-dihydroxy-2-naphthoyl-CoA hydrolase|uniref:hotdog fold thioesterase n=1 Tax=Oceanospirillaceae TaxID=135620 RepID=UPI000C38EDD3|nr:MULTISPECIES: hotdog fold thioesterase [Thalassolituus]MAY13795.1 esterase [Oceanospirillaceae bacterium]PIQ42323.1 MAG: esterase [Thalassolituus sp. CG17_big_fil_post_rev_8_21_14_2_50_53_8]MCA6061236.1 hotdog fold thioesterase [Thalassolituus sp. ST750PaO-4]MCB2388140.1 hotdog fold thioesterase [Thalassolituus alkanivorans]MCB2424679.1 hotdog fold thioesterase [Thalassolituus alkanivorans]